MPTRFEEGQVGPEKAQLELINEKGNEKKAELKKILVDKLWTVLSGKTCQGIRDYFGAQLYAKGTKFSRKMLEDIDYMNLSTDKWVGDKRIDALVEKTINNYIIKWKEAEAVVKREQYNLTNGDELPTGIIQLAKVYIAKKRKTQSG